MFRKALPATVVGFLLSVPAFAVPVGTSFFSASDTNVSASSPGGYVFDRGTDVTADGTVSAATASLDLTELVEGQAMAQADLATGTLRAYAGLTDFYDDAANANASTYAAALFGDSFTHLSGDDPFLFSDGAASTFRFTIDGITDRSDSGFHSEAWLRIFILEAGTLANAVRDDGRMLCCIPEFTDNVIDWTVIGLTPETEFSIDFLDPDVVFIPIDTLSGDTFEYSFSPGRDFDWAVELTVVAGVNSLANPAPSGNHVITDFHNTIDVDYVAPSGASVRSASGVFPVEAVAVPEPGTAGLLAGGLLWLAIRRKPLGAAVRTRTILCQSIYGWGASGCGTEQAFTTA